VKVLGIDPGTGVASPTALALIDTETNALIQWWVVQPSKFQTTHQQRVAYIAQEVQYIIYKEHPDLIFCETFVMQGRSGMLLHQLIGAIMAAAGHRHGDRFGSVFNTTVKRLVTGNGGADKVEVALGVQKQLTASTEELVKLTVAKQFDVTDAAAIAIAGVLQQTEEALDYEQPTKTRRKSKARTPSTKSKKAVKKSSRRSGRILRRRRSTKH
jgi:Holliday junction resolvasome RuvABC endonuclease subunit